jgi:hypothetical protein
MVQVIQYSPQAAQVDERMRGGLANALNSGGDQLATHLAERGLKQAMSSAGFQNASPEQKALQLQQATAPYGQSGQRLLQPYLQQFQIEKQQAQQGLLSRALNGEKLSPQEQSMLGAPEQIEMAKLRSKEDIERFKAQNRPPPGGTTSQAVPPKFANDMLKIDQENPGASAAQKKQLYDAAGIPPIYTNSNIETQRREDEAKAKRHSDISQKTLENVEEIARGLPVKESSLDLMENAIANKDLSFWSKDNLAEITGIEGFRSPEGAIFKTAGKEFFLGNIRRAGARPNQWIEQQIADMMPKIGRSPEANLSVARALENEIELDKERIKLTNQLADELESKLGYVPRDLSSRVNEKLAQFAEGKQKELYNDLRAYKSIGEGSIEKFQSVPLGTPISKVVAKALLNQYGNDPVKSAEAAKKLGYQF